MWTWLLGGLIIFLWYIHYATVGKKIKNVEKMFPGPPGLPIVGNGIAIFMNRHRMFDWFGDVIWFYRRSLRLYIFNTIYIFLYEAHDVEKVWSGTTHLSKADTYTFMTPWLGNGLLLSTGNRWRKTRKILTPAFHFNILEGFLEIFKSNGKVLCKKFAEMGDKTFNCHQLFKLYALDNICECAMGSQIDAQNNPNGAYVMAIKDMCEIVFSRALQAWYWFDTIFKYSTLGKRQEKALSIIHGLTYKMIEKRRKNLENTNDKFNSEVDNETNIKKKRVFMDILLMSNESGGLTDEEIREEVDTFMFEGHDTISSGLSFALYCLAENPQFQQIAYQEQLSIFGDSDREANSSDLTNMKYLEMVIKETLRLYPSVPNVGRVAAEDIVLDDRATIPKGCEIILPVSVLHRTHLVWEKPFEFYPEHFTLEAIAKRHPFQYMPFSAGPRNCIGMRFAMMEMKFTICELLRNYEILPAEPAVPLELNVDLILNSNSGIQIRAKPRKTL